MQKLLAILLVWFAVSCGDHQLKSNNCTTVQVEGGAEIVCDDGARSFVSNGDKGKDGDRGVDGKNGKNGSNGQDGVSLVFQTMTDPSSLNCLNGGSIILIARDTNGNGVLDLEDSDIQSTQICNGKDGQNGTNGTDGTNGRDGVDGKDGVDGQNGRDGTDGVAGQDGKDGLDGHNGVDGRDGQNGTDGKDGQDGKNGSDGAAGTNGKDGAAGRDGVDGKDGRDGVPSAFTPVELLNPCGDAPGVLDEVLIKLSNGLIIASVSDKVNGENTRLSIVPAGSYITTDDDKCKFTIDASGNLTNQHH